MTNRYKPESGESPGRGDLLRFLAENGLHVSLVTSASGHGGYGLRNPVIQALANDLDRGNTERCGLITSQVAQLEYYRRIERSDGPVAGPDEAYNILIDELDSVATSGVIAFVDGSQPDGIVGVWSHGETLNEAVASAAQVMARKRNGEPPFALLDPGHGGPGSPDVFRGPGF